ncbi:hypothetical protein DSO57_1000891 [Entomophthora muscae]|uniref:Uncharacterized protein n=1 Tax=Entomophthora muscae TaxID=34485 RepID=A0ACC2SY85_9FUNG|nr:hypothetical protein DSO57_1000891 [Entomophthora muscae]
MSISSCISRALTRNSVQSKRVFSTFVSKSLPTVAVKPQSLAVLNVTKNWTRKYADFDTRRVFKGDWICVECEAHNFQRNMNCFRCKAEVSDEAKLKVEKSSERTGRLGLQKLQRFQFELS